MRRTAGAVLVSVGARAMDVSGRSDARPRGAAQLSLRGEEDGVQPRPAAARALPAAAARDGAAGVDGVRGLDVPAAAGHRVEPGVQVDDAAVAVEEDGPRAGAIARAHDLAQVVDAVAVGDAARVERGQVREAAGPVDEAASALARREVDAGDLAAGVDR